MAIPVSDSVPLLVRRNNNNGTLEEEFISGLVQGGAWTFGGGPRVITYSLESGASQGWITAMERAFDAWEQVINVRFERVDDQSQRSSTADLAISLSHRSPQVLGQGIFPDPGFANEWLQSLGQSRNVYPRPEGDIFFNSQNEVFENLAPGRIGFAVILHEIGHALGLKHAYDDGGNDRPTFSRLGLSQEWDRTHTVMAHYAIFLNDDYQATPMMGDIAAIQHIYGARTSYNAGRNTYLLRADGGYSAIWDTGGVDTLSAASWRNRLGVKIDLREGELSGASNEWTTGIAYGVAIENAIGSGKPDSLRGNNGKNRLQGRDGSDTLQGGVGDDVLDGGGGNDRMYGGRGNDLYMLDRNTETVSDSAGVDTIKGTADGGYILPSGIEHLILAGLAKNGAGNASANRMTGNGFANLLDGAGGDDTLRGHGGDDTLAGGSGNDSLDGGAGADSLSGGEGGDAIAWDPDDARVDGGLGVDTLEAGVGDLDLTGAAGAKIFEIEVIDLTGNGASALTLTDLLVSALSSETDTLTVLGDEGDVVNAIGFTQSGEAPPGFVAYASGAAVLHVHEDVNVITAV